MHPKGTRQDLQAFAAQIAQPRPWTSPIYENPRQTQRSLDKFFEEKARSSELSGVHRAKSRFVSSSEAMSTIPCRTKGSKRSNVCRLFLSQFLPIVNSDTRTDFGKSSLDIHRHVDRFEKGSSMRFCEKKKKTCRREGHDSHCLGFWGGCKGTSFSLTSHRPKE